MLKKLEKKQKSKLFFKQPSQLSFHRTSSKCRNTLFNSSGENSFPLKFCLAVAPAC